MPFKFRSRSIERFGQFGGKACLEALGDTQTCKSSEVCPEEPELDCGTDFQCNSGRFCFHAIASKAVTQKPHFSSVNKLHQPRATI